MTCRSKIAKMVPIVNPSWLPFRVCSNDHAQLTGMPYIFFFKIKNCLNDDFFISCDDRIGKMLHNICISAVAMSLRGATRGPWASCLLDLIRSMKVVSFRLSCFPPSSRLYKMGISCYAPRRISGEHIVAASSVRPCVRPALVHANSRKLLVGFQ